MKYLSPSLILFFFFCVSLQTRAQFRDQLSRQQWKKEMSEALPKKWCEPNAFFSSCYNISVGRCQKQVAELIKECFPRLPAKINLHSNGIKFGGSLGRCVGIKFHDLNHDNYKDHPQCKAAAKWK